MKPIYCWIACAITYAVLTTNVDAQTGHVLDAVGPVNQSMGGAGTGLPLDAIGALHWNPASIAGLKKSEVGFGFMAFAPASQLSSSVDAGAFGPGFPAASMQGSTCSDTDINPIPSLAVVYREKNSPWTIGLGGFAIGGFGVDYPTSPDNPILSPQPAQGGVGFGAVHSQFQMMQFCPTVAREISSGWSVGFAPTFNWATLAIDPFSAAAPNPDGSYASAAHTDAAWGVGFQTGVYFESIESGWSFGLTYKSPQWFEQFSINGSDNTGRPRVLKMDLDYPAIVSAGLGYRGFDRFAFAWDLRYIDYENTDGFQAAGFDSTGAVTGFGWKSIFSFATGVEYTVNRRLKWRVGYTFNESPISNKNIFFNSPAPALVQHHLSTGFTYEFGSGWMCSLAYHHGFENSVSGKWWHPTAGEVGKSEVTSTLSTHGVIGGISKQF